MKPKTALDHVREWTMINIGVLLSAVGIYFFKTPYGFATGGVSGLSILLARAFPVLSQALYMAIIDTSLLVIGVIVLGRVCGLRTVYCTLMLSAENLLLERLFPLSGPLTDNPLLELIYAMLLTGIGAAILFNYNASSGGTDIVALIIKKYSRINVSVSLLLSDALIAGASFFVYDVKTGLFSVLGLLAKVLVVDDIVESFNTCKSFIIITTKAEEIENIIIHKFNHSATVTDAVGAYSGEQRKMVVSVCRRAEALTLRRVVKECDPNAFIIITKSSEIIGKGFREV